MSDIKPCPFCGHIGLQFGEGSTFRWLAYSCAGCGVGSETRVQTLGDGTPEQWLDIAKQHAVAEWNRRATPAVPAEPAGWRLVPIEPTEFMLEHGNGLWEWPVNYAADLWRAMLAAAPEPALEQPAASVATQQPIPISAGKRIADEFGYDQIVIVGRREGGFEHVTTYGRNEAHCGVAARMGNFFKHKLMGWPEPDTGDAK